MTTSIYYIPIDESLGIAKHYFISSDGTFENSMGWGPNGVEYKGTGVELNPEQHKRILDYSKLFREYNIHRNNCEMFAWYVMTGQQYSSQIQDKIHTAIGALAVSFVQPVLTVRSYESYQLKQAIANKLNQDLEISKKEQLKQQQKERDEFWRKRDAGEL